MNSIVIFATIVGLAAAAPGLYYTHESHETHAIPVYHTHTISSPSKTTITKNSQVVNHGGHKVVHVPVKHEIHTLVQTPVHYEPVHSYVHEPVHTLVHEPVHTLVQEPTYVHKAPAKSSSYFKLENTEYKTQKVVPVVQTHKVVSVPVVQSYHAPLVSRSGDSAVSHQSSTTHETVHEYKSLPLYALHH